MFIRKNTKSRVIIFITVFILMISQTLSVFADIVLPGMENTAEIPTQTEATMWLEQKGNKWYTKPSEDGENSAIFTTEVLHTTCRAYHTIGYVLFLGKEGCSINFSANSIDMDIPNNIPPSLAICESFPIFVMATKVPTNIRNAPANAAPFSISSFDNIPTSLHTPIINSIAIDIFNIVPPILFTFLPAMFAL